MASGTNLIYNSRTSTNEIAVSGSYRTALRRPIVATSRIDPGFVLRPRQRNADNIAGQ
jgi:hypothetical protein